MVALQVGQELVPLAVRRGRERLVRVRVRVRVRVGVRVRVRVSLGKLASPSFG